MRKVSMLCLVICVLSTKMLIAQSEMPDRDQRIYSLSKIWKELEYNFGFPEKLKQANLDSLYMAYLPKVADAKSNYEYYRLMSSFMAHFNDAHTRVLSPQRLDDIPPVKAINFGEKIIISDVAKTEVGNLPVGSEVLSINHIPVLEYLKDSIFPYIAAATPQWKFDKSVLEMFTGEPGTTVHIAFRTPEGNVKEINMVRNYFANGEKEVMINKNQPPITIKILDDDIGYMKLSSFAGMYVDTINQVFANNLLQLKKCKGLIIDIRGNRGGSDLAWENIVFHLMPEAEYDMGMKFFSRIHIATYKNWGINSTHPKLQEYNQGLAMTEVEHSQYENKVEDSEKLDYPVVIISGQHVASAAEDLLLLMKNRKRAIIVGESSVGCVSEPMFLPLTNGFNVMICAKIYVNPDGSQPNDGGIMPDVYVKADYDSYLKGEDNMLAQGINELRMQINK